MKSEWPKKQTKAKDILGEGCGGLDAIGGKCLENGTISRISADVQKIHQGSNVREWISERETRPRTSDCEDELEHGIRMLDM